MYTKQGQPDVYCVIARTVQYEGRVRAQAVSRRLTTTAAPGFQLRSSHMGFVMDKVAQGQVFSENFGFTRQFLFHRLLHTHHNTLHVVVRYVVVIIQLKNPDIENKLQD
jgi:hypothetical protein